jgi:hypothetical protein
MAKAMDMDDKLETDDDHDDLHDDDEIDQERGRKKGQKYDIPSHTQIEAGTRQTQFDELKHVPESKKKTKKIELSDRSDFIVRKITVIRYFIELLDFYFSNR